MVFKSNCDIIEDFDDNPLSQSSARDFVQCVMAAPNLSPAFTDIQSSQCDKVNAIIGTENKTVSTVALVHRSATPRKRQLSNDTYNSTEASDPKKSKSSFCSEKVTLSSDVSASFLIEMFESLSRDLNSAVCKIETRIDNLESNIEKRLTQKISENVMKNVRCEIQNAKSEFNKKISVMENKVGELSKSYAEVTAVKPVNSHPVNRQDCEVIVRNLPADVREEADSSVLKQKVISLVKDLKLKNVFVENVVRKKSYGPKSGVVVVTVQNVDQKRELLKAKRNLKDIAKYSDVFIENSMSYSERVNKANFRTLLKAVSSDNQDFTINRGRIVKHNSHSSQTSVNRGDLNQHSYNGDTNPQAVSRDNDLNTNYHNQRQNYNGRGNNRRGFGRGRGRQNKYR